MNKNSIIITLLLVASSVFSSFGKKLCYPLEVIAGMADLIVVGEIEKTHYKSYDFKINETVKGASQGSIRVQMFEEWTCDTRSEKAKKGQKLFLFLTEVDGKYEIIGGSDGEMFFEEEKVMSKLDGMFNYHKLSSNELAAALRFFTACYKLREQDEEDYSEYVFIRLKSKSEIKKLSATTEFTTWLFDKVKKHKVREQSK